ncbi:lipoprotein-releasing system permease protein [Ruminobacter amylophilus]|jgi:lipoprotein-releasing system permease protein|uniref:Lipoprotein-releasing system permease protein n=1 Tax=Ruminobacter amylophilus TaxID=867 RepID=A0A662ZFY7_9GAMM|nr:lipoprotein-releasing ABC transporter permease subunit [Ruminobacter amylophilus]SFP17140.1 lipoprotein-releasing system permease protein [Ruminobacter amylophilus]
MSVLKLFRPLSLSIGLRYAFASSNHRFATFIALLSMIGIMLGVAALIVVVSVMNGLEGELKDRLLSSIPHAVITTDRDMIAQDYDLSRIRDIKGVVAVAPQITDDVMIQGRNGIYGVSLFGIDPADYPDFDLVRASTGTKSFKSLVPRSFEIIVGWDVLDRLKNNVDDELRIISASYVKYTPFGRVPSQRLFTVNGAYSVGGMSSGMILGNIEDVRRLTHMQQGTVSGFRVWLDDPFEVGSFIEEVGRIDPKLTVKDWRVELGEFFQSVAMERIMMGLMLALIIMVAIFNMLSSLAMVVSSKVPEIAVMRTMGMSQSAIMKVFIVEGAISGIIGSVMGLILGLICVAYLDSILNVLGINLYIAAGGVGIPVQVKGLQVLMVLLVTIALSFAITIYPSVRAARQSPVESLRYE